MVGVTSPSIALHGPCTHLPPAPAHQKCRFPRITHPPRTPFRDVHSAPEPCSDGAERDADSDSLCDCVYYDDFDADCIAWSQDACPFDAAYSQPADTCESDCVVAAQGDLEGTAAAAAATSSYFWDTFLRALADFVDSADMTAFLQNGNGASLDNLRAALAESPMAIFDRPYVVSFLPALAPYLAAHGLLLLVGAFALLLTPVFLVARCCLCQTVCCTADENDIRHGYPERREAAARTAGGSSSTTTCACCPKGGWACPVATWAVLWCVSLVCVVAVFLAVGSFASITAEWACVATAITKTAIAFSNDLMDSAEHLAEEAAPDLVEHVGKLQTLLSLVSSWLPAACRQRHSFVCRPCGLHCQSRFLSQQRATYYLRKCPTFTFC
jgi:hypothetical protein